jgi:hypothetical protein
VLGADDEETLDAAMRALTVGEEEEDEEGEEGDSDEGEEDDQAGDSCNKGVASRKVDLRPACLFAQAPLSQDAEL